MLSTGCSSHPDGWAGSRGVNSMLNVCFNFSRYSLRIFSVRSESYRADIGGSRTEKNSIISVTVITVEM